MHTRPFLVGRYVYHLENEQLPDIRENLSNPEKLVNRYDLSEKFI